MEIYQIYVHTVVTEYYPSLRVVNLNLLKIFVLTDIRDDAAVKQKQPQRESEQQKSCSRG
jgi:hypothetical protein